MPMWDRLLNPAGGAFRASETSAAGLPDGIEGRGMAMTAATGAAILLLAASAWLAGANLAQVRRADNLGDEVHSVQILSDRLLATLTDAETGQRGYLLTKDPAYLEPYTAARLRLAGDLANLRSQSLMRGLTSRMDGIQTLAAAKMAELDETVALARAGRSQTALRRVRSNQGKQIMDALRVQIQGLGPIADAELKRERVGARSGWPRAGVVGLGVLSSLLLAGVALEQRRRRRAVSASLALLERFTRGFGLSQGMLRSMGGKITFWAEGMQRLYGFTAEEAVGRSSHELLQTVFPLPLSQIEAILVDTGAWKGELVHIHRDGHALEVASHWALHHGLPGQTDAVIEFDNDISEARSAEREVARQTAELTEANARLTIALAERISAEKTLARSAAEFRASFEAAAVGKVQVDPESGCFIRVNRAFAGMLGYSPEELVGRPCWDLTWPDDRADGESRYDRLLSGDADVYVRETRFVRRSGQPVWTRVSATMVRRPDDGAPMLVIAVVEDIDESRRAQIALHDAKLDLECVVAERTTALAQRDLLLREVYHRVKNNLQIIDSLLVLQARQLSDAAGKQALLGLRNRVYALGLVHHQLMESADLKTFDVAPFLKEITANLLAGGAGREVGLSVRAIPLDVGLDFAIPLGLLVTELVTNSLKHAFPDGSGQVEVVLERAADGSMVLVVADDGEGYPMAEDVPSAGRIGLGSSIIEGLVAQLKGTLVISADGGTRSEIRVAAPVNT